MTRRISRAGWRQCAPRRDGLSSATWWWPGIGVEPNSELLAAAGAAVDNGVLVDEHCRTSLPDVYAAGDVANHLHPLFGRLRVEHWNNGHQQGRAAARSMLGGTEPFDYLHSFWSDQALVCSRSGATSARTTSRQLRDPDRPWPRPWSEAAGEGVG